MKKTLIFVLVLCLLLSGCSGSYVISEPDSSQESKYKVLRCDGKNFSVLFSRDNTAVSNENGATIFTADEDELNKVEISVIFDGDTTGFDVTQYFLFRAEDMESEDGIQYTLYEDMTQSSAGNGTMSGAVYSFTTEGETDYRYDRLYDPNTGEVYRAELGFYDNYDINRDEYSNPNLQIIDGSTENYYLDGVDYYITE